MIDKYGLTQESAAKKLGKSRSAVTNSLRLLAPPEDVAPYGQRGQAELWPRQGSAGIAQ